MMLRLMVLGQFKSIAFFIIKWKISSNRSSSVTVLTLLDVNWKLLYELWVQPPVTSLTPL